LIEPSLERLKKLGRFIGISGGLWLGAGAAGGLFLSVIELGVAGLLQELLGRLGMGSPQSLLYAGPNLEKLSVAALALLFFVTGLLRSAVTALIGYSASHSQEIIGLRLKSLLLHETLGKASRPLSLAEAHFKLGSIFPRAIAFCSVGATALPHALNILGLLTILLSMSPLTALIGALGLAMVGVPAYFFNVRVRTLSSVISHQAGQINSKLSRSILNLFFLKAISASDRVHEELANDISTQTRVSLSMYRLVHLSATLPIALSSLLVAALIYFQLRFELIAGAAFPAFIYVFIRFGQYLSSVAGQLGVLSNYYPQFKDAVEFLLASEPVERNIRISGMTRRSIPTKSAKLPPPSISFENVDFRYDESSFDVLTGLSFQAAAGELFCFSGDSGSGKSTILALVLGIQSPTSGKVTIDGWSAEDYQRRTDVSIGYVGPEPFIIEGSIRDNLLFGHWTSVPDETLWRVLKAAELADELLSSRKNLDFQLSETGGGLSAGQKQRLSLARALLREPNLLILDEATANLDAQNELKIIETIKRLRGEMTILAVSHRPAILAVSDQILHLARQQPENHD
jgi:ABC-type bacteriocin/lantibiotic exporter with double-glycine peptidase domain